LLIPATAAIIAVTAVDGRRLPASDAAVVMIVTGGPVITGDGLS
jgi:hypothetical protein